jgi:hypothetical protein
MCINRDNQLSIAYFPNFYHTYLSPVTGQQMKCVHIDFIR